MATEESQASAEQRARPWLRSNGGGEVSLTDEGEFSHIRKSDAV